MRNTLTSPNGIVATYGYDNANHLTTLRYSLGLTTVGDLTYTYDAAGSRTSVSGSWARTGIPAALTSATYDAANRLTTWDSTSFSYDPNGNLTGDGLTSYTWNARNQLVGLSGGTSATFAYDAFGRRRGKTISGTTTNFLWDEFNLVQELAANGTPIANLPMASAVDEILMRIDGAGLSTLLVDGIGSTLALADASGTVQTQYTFEPFGATTTSGPSSTNSVEFTGRENDLTGLYYYRARYYSPGTARFIAEDPLYQTQLVLPPGESLYTYVRNAPTGFIDPSGENAVAITIPWVLVPEIGIGAGIGVWRRHWRWRRRRDLRHITGVSPGREMLMAAHEGSSKVRWQGLVPGYRSKRNGSLHQPLVGGLPEVPGRYAAKVSKEPGRHAAVSEAVMRWVSGWQTSPSSFED